MDDRGNRKKKPGVLLSFPAMKTPDPQSSSGCDECERLEREYELAVKGIYSAVETTFDYLAEKLTNLHQWQDKRNRVLDELYAHKTSHSRKAGLTA